MVKKRHWNNSKVSLKNKRHWRGKFVEKDQNQRQQFFGLLQNNSKGVVTQVFAEDEVPNIT